VVRKNYLLYINQSFSNLSQTQKGILSVLGGICMHLVLGSIYSFGLLGPYMMSYLHRFPKNRDTISIDDGFFLTPIAVASTAFSFTAAGKLEKKFGPRT